MKHKLFFATLFLSALTLCACPANNDNTKGWDKEALSRMRDNLHGYVFPKYEKAEKIDVLLDLGVNYGDEQNPLYTVELDAKNCVESADDIIDYVGILRKDGFTAKDVSSEYSQAIGTVYEARRKVDDKHYIYAEIYGYVEENIATEGDEPEYIERYSDVGNFRVRAADKFDYEWPTEKINELTNFYSYKYHTHVDVDYYLPVFKADYYEMRSDCFYFFAEDADKAKNDFIGEYRDKGWKLSYLDEYDEYQLVAPDDDYFITVSYDKKYDGVLVRFHSNYEDPGDGVYVRDYWDSSIIEGFFNNYSFLRFDVPEVISTTPGLTFTYYEDINNLTNLVEGYYELICFYVEIDGLSQNDYQSYIQTLYFIEGWKLNEEPLFFYKPLEEGLNAKMVVEYNEDTSHFMMTVFLYPYYTHYDSWPSKVILDNLIAYNSTYTDTLPAYNGSYEYDYIIAYDNIVRIYSAYSYEMVDDYLAILDSHGFQDILTSATKRISPNDKYMVVVEYHDEYLEIMVVDIDEEEPSTTDEYYSYYPGDRLNEVLGYKASYIIPVDSGVEYNLIIWRDVKNVSGNLYIIFEDTSYEYVQNLVGAYNYNLEQLGYVKEEDGEGYIVNENEFEVFATCYDWGDDIYRFVLFFDNLEQGSHGGEDEVILPY